MSELNLKCTVTLTLVLVQGVLAANADFLGRITSLFGSAARNSQPIPPPPPGETGKSFNSRGGYYDDHHDHDGGDPYMMSAASQRGWGGGGGGGGGWGWDNDHQNLDLYSLLGGLSFASLLGATIIYLARRNTSGRRRRSADGLSYLEEDEMDFSEDPQAKGLNIVELIDTFLDNPSIFSGGNSGGEGGSNTSRSTKSQSEPSSKSKSHSHLGPGLVPHSLPSSHEKPTVH